MFEKKNGPDAYLDEKIEQSNRSPDFVIMSQSLDMIERMKSNKASLPEFEELLKSGPNPITDEEEKAELVERYKGILEK